MRRLVLIATALGVLVAAATAYAAVNSYTATIKVVPKAAGSVKKPAPVGYTEDLTAKSTTAGNRAAVLTDIKTTIYGFRADGKDFKQCSANKIDTAHTDAGCPKGSMVASGYITASVGAANDFTSAGAPCDPLLHVYNSGQGKLTFFFVDQGTHQCLGGALKTGSVPAYPGTYKVVGKNLVVDVPVPKYVSFPAPGLAGSLETEHLVWAKMTKQVHGKNVAAISSVGCQHKKRPYSVAYTASNGSGGSETDVVKGSAPCA